MAAPDTGMDKADMKLLLNRADPDNPISFAFAQPKDPGPALLIMDKLKNPKACERMLSAAFKDARNPRWGTVAIDPAIDPSLVRFTVEKPTTGMARRLMLTLKGTGFRKVEIVLDDGTVLEGAGDEEEGQTEQSAAAPPAAPAVTAPAAAPAAPIAALTHGLAVLVGRIGALDVDPARKATMAKVAAAANEQVKAGDVAGAAVTIAKLKQVIDASAATPVPTLAAAVTQVKSALAATEQQVAGLQKAIRRTNDDGLLTISEVGLKAMTDAFVPQVRTAVASADGADAPALRSSAAALLKTIADATRVIGSDARIAACDGNDFGVAVSIRGTLEPALAAFGHALQGVTKP